MSEKDPKSRERMNRFRDKTDKTILKKNPWRSYRLHITVLCLVIFAEFVGPVKIPLTNNVELSAMPLLWAMLGGLFLYLLKPFKVIQRKQARIAEGAMLLFIGPLLCKLAISSGQSIGVLFQVGPALLLQQIGDFGTIFLALPIAILLGFKREAIGMTNSIGREPNVAVVIDKFGFDSPEARGVLTVFIIGTVIGTLFISFLASVCVSVLPLHPYSFAMASGVGSASMNAAALAPLLAAYPDLSTNIEAFSGFSNLISFCIGIYVCMFIAIPLAQKVYAVLEPRIGRTTDVSSGED